MPLILTLIREQVRAAVVAENEACAMIADAEAEWREKNIGGPACRSIAAAIRARRKALLTDTKGEEK